MPETVPVELLTVRRLIRVGACPVLEVTVTYPHVPDGDSPAAARFNHTYRAMAEAFLAWADTLPAEEAGTAFADLGAAAPYRFDRRILTCTMTAVSKAPDRLAVIRSVTLKSRRGEMPERSITAADLWRLPAWTVVKHPKRSPKKHEKQGI